MVNSILNRRDYLQGTAVTAALLGGVPPSALAADCPAADESRQRAAAIAAAAANKKYDVTPGINPDLKAHGAIFERKIHKVGDNVYSAVGWAGCNAIMVVGGDGAIIVDTGDNIQAAREVAAEFRKVTDKPVRAVIYTCFHIDHISGVKGFVSADDVRAGRVTIIAHDTLLANVVKQAGSAVILGVRSAYNFGSILEDPDTEGMNLGTSPLGRRDRAVSFIAPTKTFTTRLDITIAGVAMHLVHVPSEAADEIAVFLPQSKILLSSEVIPAQCFPSLVPLRGEAYRNPIDWYQSIDLLRGFKAVAMVPAHGLPVFGADNVEEVLRNYRDAIQFVHDQTVRQMNKGLVPDELAQVVKLPPHLANYKPWMQEFFGTVSQTVRGIYQGYLGWFEADPVALAPLPRMESARRQVALMGGRDLVLAAAVKAFEDGDAQWAAELATLLIRIDRQDMAARRLKAAAFRKLGYAQINGVWRSWYLSAARELEGFDFLAFARANFRGSFAAPDLVAALPAKAFVEGLTTRLKAEDTLDVTMTVGFRFPDTGESCGIALRRGVAQFDEQLPETTDMTLTLDKATLDRIRLGELTLRDALLAGAIHVGGRPATELTRFFGYFEGPLTVPIQLIVR
jgi:alkyl sulfatase BDS1-like metallo-beta-lactamase superfamily hydrolase